MLTDTTTSGQSKFGWNDKEGVTLHYLELQKPILTSGCSLVSCLGRPFLGPRSYLSARDANRACDKKNSIEKLTHVWELSACVLCVEIATF